MTKRLDAIKAIYKLRNKNAPISPIDEDVLYLLSLVEKKDKAIKFAIEIFSEYPEPNIDEKEALDKMKQALKCDEGGEVENV